MLLKEETLTGGRSLIPPKGRSAFGCGRVVGYGSIRILCGELCLRIFNFMTCGI